MDLTPEFPAEKQNFSLHAAGPAFRRRKVPTLRGPPSARAHRWRRLSRASADAVFHTQAVASPLDRHAPLQARQWPARRKHRFQAAVQSSFNCRRPARVYLGPLPGIPGMPKNPISGISGISGPLVNREKPRVHLPPPRRTSRTFRLRRHLPQPSSPHQLIDDRLHLVGIEPLAQRIPAHVLAGHLLAVAGPDPAQDPTSFGVMIGQPNLAHGRAGVRPQVISPQPHRGFDEPHLDGLWFGTALHGPVEIAERAGEAQNL